MAAPTERATRPLHLFVVVTDERRPDPAGLLAALGERIRHVTVATWSRRPEPPAAPLLEPVAALIDHIEDTTGDRPRYGELHGPVARAIADGVAEIRGESTIVALSAATPPRRVRSVRRSLDRSGSHLALLPLAEHRPVDREAGS